MKLQFLKEDALFNLKSNVTYNEPKYSLSSNDWIMEYFNNESPFLDFKLDVDNLNLFMNAERPENTDVRNVKVVYKVLKDITFSQATDERLWSGLAHGHLWKYMQYRLKTANNCLDTESIESNFFFKQGQNKYLIANAVSRLWWVGKNIYDPDNKIDPFYSIKYLETDFMSKTLILFSSNFSNNPKITQALLNSVISIEENSTKLLREDFVSLIKYVNMLGGTYILDYLTKEELQDRIINHYKSTYKKKQLLHI